MLAMSSTSFLRFTGSHPWNCKCCGGNPIRAMNIPRSAASSAEFVWNASRPHATSIRMHPNAHVSTAVEYRSLGELVNCKRSVASGARYHDVQNPRVLQSLTFASRAAPKSESLSSKLPGRSGVKNNTQFEGLTSRCATPRRAKNCRACAKSAETLRPR